MALFSVRKMHLRHIVQHDRLREKWASIVHLFVQIIRDELHLKCIKKSLRTRPTFSKSVMVSVAVSKHGCTELIFVKLGVKVDGAYYRDVLLSHQMLPALRHLAGDVFVFQQDSVLAHQAHATVEYLH